MMIPTDCKVNFVGSILRDDQVAENKTEIMANPVVYNDEKYWEDNYQKVSHDLIYDR